MIHQYLYTQRYLYPYRRCIYFKWRFTALCSVTFYTHPPTHPPSLHDIPPHASFCHVLFSDEFVSLFSLNTELCRFFHVFGFVSLFFHVYGWVSRFSFFCNITVQLVCYFLFVYKQLAKTSFPTKSLFE